MGRKALFGSRSNNRAGSRSCGKCGFKTRVEARRWARANMQGSYNIVETPVSANFEKSTRKH